MFMTVRRSQGISDCAGFCEESKTFQPLMGLITRQRLRRNARLRGDRDRLAMHCRTLAYQSPEITEILTKL